MVLGGKGITEPLEAAGIETLPPIRGTPVDAVMAGWFRQELTFEALEAAVEAVAAGAEYYSASQSPYFATSEGRSLGSSRAISAVVTDLTGCAVTVVGKPSLVAFGAAARRLGLAPSELAVVGDDPELEVPMAHGRRVRGGRSYRHRPRGVVHRSARRPRRTSTCPTSGRSRSCCAADAHAVPRPPTPGR